MVIEGPEAGGHLGFRREEIEDYSRAAYAEEIRKIIKTVQKYAQKYNTEIPVVAAGGIYDSSDVKRIMALGVDGVQVATRFVTTEECDADIRYKEAYVKASREDIQIVKSPVGMPGRAIVNSFMKRVINGEKIPHSPCHRCLAKCSPAKIPYCITDGLVNAARGNIENALLFCGAQAWRAEKIDTVREAVQELFA